MVWLDLLGSEYDWQAERERRFCEFRTSLLFPNSDWCNLLHGTETLLFILGLFNLLAPEFGI